MTVDASEAKHAVSLDTSKDKAVPSEETAEHRKSNLDEEGAAETDTTKSTGERETVAVAADAIEKSESNASEKGNGNVRTWDNTSRKVIVHKVLKYIKGKDVPKLVDSWLEKLSDPNIIKVHKIKKPPNKNWAAITLESDSMVQPFLDLINNNRITNPRGEVLFAKRADAGGEGDDRDKKRKNGDDKMSNRVKKQKQEQDATNRLPKSADEVRDSMTPKWREPYEKQLIVKTREMRRRCANKILNEVKAKFRTIQKEAKKNEHRKSVEEYDWIKQSRSFDVKPILPSPHQLEYRNKCEFTFGYRQDILTKEAKDVPSTNDDNGNNEASDNSNVKDSEVQKTPCVGFMASGWSGGVSRPHSCQNVPSEACAIADIIDDFLRSSPVPPYESRVHRGVWRTVAIRTSKRTGECMIVVVHAPPSGGVGARDDGTDDYSEVFAAEKERLVEMLADKELPTPERDYPEETEMKAGPARTNATANGNASCNSTALKASSKSSCPVRVTSIFFQEYDGVSAPKPDHPVQHAFGKLTLHEKLGKCSFQISPGAFFQVNTECAEVLYNVVVEKVKEVASNPGQTLLLDVCCGTGTIGLTCMKEGVVGRVVGVDISEPAIQDAKINAELNGFSNRDENSDDASTRFVASRAELVLAEELRKVESTPDVSIIAVVDPAREGLHSDVIKAIRASEKIQRLVYVSCNPTVTLVQDAGFLCSPQTRKYKGQPFRPTSAQPVDMFPLTAHCEMVMTFDRLDE